MIQAAGLMLLHKSGDGDKVLFIKRSDQGDHAGEWCFPGGKIEPGETPEEAAERETREEIGAAPHDNPALLTRRIQDGVDFTTYLARTKTQFVPTLNGESTAFAWASPEAPPEPLHPGCRVALARLEMNELDIARAIAAGELVSPQWFRNVLLVAIRITGTGASYRSKQRAEKGDKIVGPDGKKITAEGGEVVREDEFVWRDPSLYLNDEFLARCNGLQVVWAHPPKKPVLNSKEFGERTVGSVMLAYIKGDEVWGIAKIYDDDAIGELLSERNSTSPGVLIDETNIIKIDKDTRLNVESKLSLLDHIAIVPNGVWDKGGPPTGVQNDLLPTQPETMETLGMADTDANAAIADAARKDSEKIDAVLDALKGLSGRMDSFDKDRKDAEEKKAEEERADKARKDAADKEEAERVAKDRKDTARKDRFGACKDGESDDDLKKRFDADEDAARKDAMEDGCDETAAVDRARKDRKDAETAEEARALKKADEDRKDAARKDAAVSNTEVEALRAKIAQLESAYRREVSADERDALAGAQARADAVAALHGERVREPMVGEDALSYRRALAETFKRHSANFASTSLATMDAATLTSVESQIYADATNAARSKANGQVGIIVPRTRNVGGRTITEYEGDIAAAFRPFLRPGTGCKLNTNLKGA